MLIKKQFDLSEIVLDTDSWKKELDDQMDEQIKEAARDWLKTVISIVPVWSRASQATFKPLADAVGFVIPTQPLVAGEDRTALGRQLSKGGLEITSTSYHFTYETNLDYLAFNEFNHAEFPNAGIFSPAGLKTPTPFNFTGQAAEQFMQITPKMPNPFDFINGRRL